MSTRATVVTAALAVFLAAGSAWAQPLGSFRWQLQPYCNVLTLNVIGEGGNYTLDGTDDLCAAPQKASVTGLAFPNPDGSIGFGLTIVTTGGEGVSVKAVINLVTLGGTWSDGNGNSGTFPFTPGAGTGGSPRPLRLPGATRLSFPFNLGPGETSALIDLPPNIPVSLKGATTTSGFRGVGQAEVLSIPGAGGFIEWVGLHSTSLGTISHNYSGAPGSVILYIDFSQQVRVEVGGSASSNQIRVTNSSGATRTGVIILIY